MPFELDRSSTYSLKDQLADGIRQAIWTGSYRPEDVLLSLSSAAVALEVSNIVARAAYRRLVAAGLIVSRLRILFCPYPKNDKYPILARLSTFAYKKAGFSGKRGG